MKAAELRLSVIYGVEGATNELRVIGSAKVSVNELKLTFGEGMLGQLAAGVFRPFVLVSKDLHSWPALPPDLASRPLETKIWANPRGKRKDHRPLIWEGWPVEPSLVVLRPAVVPTELDRYEPKQSGFVLHYKPEEASENGDRRGSEGGGESDSGAARAAERSCARSAGVADARDSPGEGDDQDDERGDGLRTLDRSQSETNPDGSVGADAEGDSTPAGRDGEAPVGERWDVQVAWIRAQLAEGRTVAGVAAEIELPVSSVRAARTWKPPEEATSVAWMGEVPVDVALDVLSGSCSYTPEELESKRIKPKKKKPRSLD
jgi:hypothetical protein